MPKGYIIGHITIRDPERYKDYVAADTPVFESHNATFLVRGGACEVVEGDLKERHVVIEFESYAAARACYFSPEYQAAAAIRREAADGDMLLVEGTPD